MYKKTNFYICALFLSLVLTFNTSSGNCAQKSLFTVASSVPQIYEYTLKNGLNVLIQEKDERDLVALEIIVKTGSLFEGKKQGAGLAHLLEHMIFKGTQKRNALKIDDEIKELGGLINGYTSHQFTGFTLLLPSENFEAGLEILSDILRNPVFDENELKKEKDVILSEIKMNRDDPKRYFQREFWKHAFGISPYNLPILGYESLFEALKREDLCQFHNKWYIPNNMIIAVAGNIDQAKAFDIISKHFNDFPIGNFPEAVLPQLPALKSQQNFEIEYDVTTSRMMIGFASVELAHKDSAALDIIAALLGTGKSARLYQPLVKEKQLAYSVSAFNYTPGFRGIFAINLLFDFKNKDAALKEIFKIIAELKKISVGKKELKKIKNIYTSDYIFAQEKVASLASSMATDKAYTNNPSFSADYLKNISSLTPDDIQRCAKKYLSDTDFITVILKPNTSKSTESTPLIKKKATEEIKEITLDNGMRILLKKDSSIAGFFMQASFGGGVRWEFTSNNGIFNLISKMLLKGTKKRSALEIARSCEQMGASISSFSGYNSFGLSLNALSKDITDAFDIFADLILNSNFPKDEIENEKRLTLKGLDLEEDDIFQSTFNLLKTHLFNDYPYRLNPHGNSQALIRLKQSDLKLAYRQFVNPNNFILSVFGDFDEIMVEEMIKKKFSKFKSVPMPSVPQFNEIETQVSKTIKNKRDKKQALLMLAFAGCDIKNPDKVNLEFLSSLLSGTGGILYKNIREEHGFSYTLGGSTVSGLDTGFLYIYVATKPVVIEEVTRIVFAEISKIINGEIKETDIELTKKHLIARKRISLESNSSLGFTVSLNVLYGLGIDYHNKYEGLINSINKTSLINTAKKYLDIEKSVLIITKDEF